jgi:hypothetical protein
VRLDLRSPTYWSDLWLGAPGTLAALGKAPVGEVKLALGDGRALALPKLDGVGTKTVVTFVDEKPPSALAAKVQGWSEGVDLALDEGSLALAPARRKPEMQAAIPAGRYRAKVGLPVVEAGAQRARLAELAGEHTLTTVEGQRRKIEMIGVILGLVIAVLMVLFFRWWAVVAGPALGFAVMRIVMNRAAKGMSDHPEWQKLAEAERALSRESPDVVVLLQKS